jgi:hypothetical protein
MVVARGEAIEFYEQVRGLMSVELPSTLGRNFSVTQGTLQRLSQTAHKFNQFLLFSRRRTNRSWQLTQQPANSY